MHTQNTIAKCDDGNIAGKAVGGVGGGVIGSLVGKGSGKTKRNVRHDQGRRAWQRAKISSAGD